MLPEFGWVKYVLIVSYDLEYALKTVALKIVKTPIHPNHHVSR